MLRTIYKWLCSLFVPLRTPGRRVGHSKSLGSMWRVEGGSGDMGAICALLGPFGEKET
jgi:hypothetical protein